MIPIDQEQERPPERPPSNPLDWGGIDGSSDFETHSLEGGVVAFEAIPLDETTTPSHQPVGQVEVPLPEEQGGALSSSLSEQKRSPKELPQRETKPPGMPKHEGDDVNVPFRDETEAALSPSLSGHKRSPKDLLRRKKKPPGIPKRALTAYNIFFQRESAKLTAEQDKNKVGFEAMGKIIGRKWRSLDKEEKETYKKLAAQDSERYRKEMQAYSEIQQAKQHEAAAATAGSDTASAQINRGYQSEGPQQQGYQPIPQQPQFVPQYTGPDMYYYPAAPLSFQTEQQQQQQLPGVGTASSPYYHQPTAQYPQQGSPPIGPVVAPRTLQQGQNIIVQDQNGAARQYRVDYAVVRMTREQADKYIRDATSR